MKQHKFSYTKASRIFFTSDQHFSHSGIIEYANRPFHDVASMNEGLITNWNKVVRNQDIVFHLGDVTLGNFNQFNALIGRLHGKIYIVPGNHDRNWITHYTYNKTGDSLEILDALTDIKIDNTWVVLCHYPLFSWNGSKYGSVQIHGHSHGSIEERPNQFDVGVDVPEWGYSPVDWRVLCSKLG